MLLLQLLEQMSTIAMAAYILSQMGLFRNIVRDKLNNINKISIVAFLSVVSIIGTYTGVGLQPYALANTRPIGVIVSGYIGGPLIGVIVGTIAGVHRYTLGGFTAVSCGIASIIEGLVGGLIRKYSRNQNYNVMSAALAGIVGELLQMVIILLTARPYNSALQLVQKIAFPMIVVNSLGVVVFVLIIRNTIEKHNRIGAIQAQRVLGIAKAANEYLRNGFDEENAEKVAGIIKEMGNVKGVFLANQNRILTYKGGALDKNILVEKFEACLKENDEYVIEYKEDKKEIIFLCVSIKGNGGELHGAIGLRVRSKGAIDKYFIEFARELSNLLANQIELNNLNKLEQSVVTAELKALRAQIHPHFLFNALNTISSFCRTNPSKARELILNLSDYFRNTLRRTDDLVALTEEIGLIESYINIEKARFGERLQLFIDIPQEFRGMRIPTFVLQPLVENSIKHGISRKIDGGSIYITIKQMRQELIFSVRDTGTGMDEIRYNEVVSEWPGIGLRNINERLRLLYGRESRLAIANTPGEGTEITFKIPIEGGVLNG